MVYHNINLIAAYTFAPHNHICHNTSVVKCHLSYTVQSYEIPFGTYVICIQNDIINSLTRHVSYIQYEKNQHINNINLSRRKAKATLFSRLPYLLYTAITVEGLLEP